MISSWKNSDTSRIIVDHEIKAHVFVGISLSSCLSYAHQTMSRNMEKEV